MTTYIPKGEPLDAEDREWLQDLLNDLGPTLAARRVGLSRSAFAGAVAGFSCYRGTHALVRAARLIDLAA